MIDYTFFEKLLSERLNKLCESIEHKNTHIAQIQNTHHKDNGDIVGAGLQGNLEMGMIDLYQQEINDIRNSLQKIKDGVFGICEMCDDDIDVERLKANLTRNIVSTAANFLKKHKKRRDNETQVLCSVCCHFYAYCGRVCV